MNLTLAEKNILERVRSRTGMGSSLARVGQFESALQEFWGAFRLATAARAGLVGAALKETLLQEWLGVLLRLQRYAEASDLVSSEFAQEGEVPATVHYAAGLAFFHLGNFARAAAEMRHCLARRGGASLVPAWPEVLGSAPNHCLGISLLRGGQPAAAAEALEDALVLDPNSRGVHLDLATCLDAVGRPREALLLVQQLIAEEPNCALAWRIGGAIALARSEDINLAMKWTRAAVKHFPRDPVLVAQLAEALLLGGCPGESLVFWRKLDAMAQHGTHAPRIICELMLGNLSSPVFASDESVVSQDFERWFGRLMEMGAHSSVELIQGRVSRLQRLLPTAVRRLGGVWELVID